MSIYSGIRVQALIVVLIFVAGISFLGGLALSPTSHITITAAWTDVAQAIVQGVGLFSFILFWVDRQYNEKWNRIRESLNLTWSTPYYARREAILTLEKRYNLNRKLGQVMPSSLVGTFEENEEKDLRDFFDHLEEICAAQKLKVFDDGYFESIWAPMMRLNFTFFKPFIIDQRKKLNQQNLFTDIEDFVMNNKKEPKWYSLFKN